MEQWLLKLREIFSLTGRLTAGRTSRGGIFQSLSATQLFLQIKLFDAVPERNFVKRATNSGRIKLMWTRQYLAIKSYDASPYDRCIERETSSFRNYMEGFILEDKCDEDDQKEKICSEKEGKFFTRKLHNTVSNNYYVMYIDF